MTLYAIAKKDEWAQEYLISSRKRVPEFTETLTPACFFTSTHAAFRYLSKQEPDIRDSCEVVEIGASPTKAIESTEVFPRYSIAGANIGILVNGNILSTQDGCCPKIIYLRNHKVEEPINTRSAVTFALGSLLEGPFAESHPWVQMNLRPKETLLVTDNCGLGLEADGYDKERKIAWELKSVSSTSTLKTVFAEGKYKLPNVIQLACYLLFLDTEDTPMNSGILRYTSVIYDKFTSDKVKYNIKAGDTFNFKVQWEGERLHVDGKPTIITASAISGFVEYVAFVLENNPPANQVLSPVDEEGTKIACQYCHWKNECQAAEQNNLTMQEFVELCKEKV
jgi:hypothetical protein